MAAGRGGRWIVRLAWLDARRSGFRGLLMLVSMVFGLSVMVSFGALKESFRESFYLIACEITGGDLRVDLGHGGSERLGRLLHRVGDSRTAYWVRDLRLEDGEVMTLCVGADNPRWEAEENRLEWRARVYGELPSLELTVQVDVQGFEKGVARVGEVETLLNREGLAGWSCQVEPVTTGEVKPLWMQRLGRESGDIVVGRLTEAVGVSDLFGEGWRQIWFFRMEGNYAAVERAKRAGLILDYLLEEAVGHDLVWELPVETPFHRSYRMVANTLFLAAFIALVLGTLAYTVTFVDFFRGRAGQVALLRSLGASSSGSWAVYGVQVLLYAGVSVGLAGVFSIGIQHAIPAWVTVVTGQELGVEVYWRPLLASLLFGGIFVLIPGLAAILPLLGCEPVEVLRSVKMPSHLAEHRWMQRLLGLVFLVSAVTYCMYLVEDRLYALGVIVGMCLVFGMVVGLVSGLRWTLRRLFSGRSGGMTSYVWHQASANLYRKQNAYGFTLSAIGFGIFLVLCLYGFFEGYSTAGGRAVMGLQDQDELGLLLPYLIWLEDVFFLNQIAGVTVLTGGVLSVFVLLTVQRRNRIHESVILGTLGGDAGLLRKLILAESMLAGFVAGVAGVGLAAAIPLVLPGVHESTGLVLPPLVLFAALLAVMSLMVGMGWLNMKGVIGYPPLEVLRRRRHFANW